MDDISHGDVVRLKKKHPCGGDEWLVLRTGADVRIECLKCHRQILVERDVFKRRVKALVTRNEPL